MLFPEHPKPVGRRRAVAEMTVAASQAAVIAPGHVLRVVDDRLDADRPDVVVPSARGEGPRAEPPLRFTVVYGLREYLAILAEALPARLLAWERARPGRRRTAVSAGARRADSAAAHRRHPDSAAASSESMAR